MNLRLQRRLASKVLRCGEGRVWIDPEKSSEVEEAITREDVRRLIGEGTIKAKLKIGNAKNIRKKRRGRGSIKGSFHSTESKKERWKKKVRAIRKLLSQLRDAGLAKDVYRRLYYLTKGGFFRDRSHVRLYLEKEGIKLNVEPPKKKKKSRKVKKVGKRTEVQSKVQKKA